MDQRRAPQLHPLGTRRAQSEQLRRGLHPRPRRLVARLPHRLQLVGHRRARAGQPARRRWGRAARFHRPLPHRGAQRRRPARGGRGRSLPDRRRRALPGAARRAGLREHPAAALGGGRPALQRLLPADADLRAAGPGGQRPGRRRRRGGGRSLRARVHGVATVGPGLGGSGQPLALRGGAAPAAGGSRGQRLRPDRDLRPGGARPRGRRGLVAGAGRGGRSPGAVERPGPGQRPGDAAVPVQRAGPEPDERLPERSSGRRLRQRLPGPDHGHLLRPGRLRVRHPRAAVPGARRARPRPRPGDRRRLLQRQPERRRPRSPRGGRLQEHRRRGGHGHGRRERQRRRGLLPAGRRRSRRDHPAQRGAPLDEPARAPDRDPRRLRPAGGDRGQPLGGGRAPRRREPRLLLRGPHRHRRSGAHGPVPDRRGHPAHRRARLRRPCGSLGYRARAGFERGDHRGAVGGRKLRRPAHRDGRLERPDRAVHRRAVRQRRRRSARSGAARGRPGGRGELPRLAHGRPAGRHRGRAPDLRADRQRRPGQGVHLRGEQRLDRARGRRRRPDARGGPRRGAGLGLAGPRDRRGAAHVPVDRVERGARRHGGRDPRRSGVPVDRPPAPLGRRRAGQRRRRGPRGRRARRRPRARRHLRRPVDRQPAGGPERHVRRVGVRGRRFSGRPDPRPGARRGQRARSRDLRAGPLRRPRGNERERGSRGRRRRAPGRRLDGGEHGRRARDHPRGRLGGPGVPERGCAAGERRRPPARDPPPLGRAPGGRLLLGGDGRAGPRPLRRSLAPVRANRRRPERLRGRAPGQQPVGPGPHDALDREPRGGFRRPGARGGPARRRALRALDGDQRRRRRDSRGSGEPTVALGGRRARRGRPAAGRDDARRRGRRRVDRIAGPRPAPRPARAAGGRLLAPARRRRAGRRRRVERGGQPRPARPEAHLPPGAGPRRGGGQRRGGRPGRRAAHRELDGVERRSGRGRHALDRDPLARHGSRR